MIIEMFAGIFNRPTYMYHLILMIILLKYLLLVNQLCINYVPEDWFCVSRL